MFCITMSLLLFADLTQAGILILLMVFVGLPLAVISIPLTLIWTHHRHKMEELRLQQQGRITDELRAEFAAVRAEIEALRDTATQYDLSFDTTLQHMDRRLTHLERQSRSQTEEAARQATFLGER